MEAFENIHPVVALLVGLFVLAWIVLLLLVPFMVESIRGLTRKQHEELRDMNRKLDRLNALLAAQGNVQPPQQVRAERPSAAEQSASRREARKEPIISEHPPYAGRQEPKISPDPGGARTPQPRNPHAARRER